MLADCLRLCEVHGVDGSEELDGDEMLDCEDEEQGNGLECEVRLVCVESSGKICRSSVTVEDSRTHRNKIHYYSHYFTIFPRYACKLIS